MFINSINYLKFHSLWTNLNFPNKKQYKLYLKVWFKANMAHRIYQFKWMANAGATQKYLNPSFPPDEGIPG